MSKKGVSKGLVEKVKEIYQEVKNVMKVGEETTEEFWTRKGVRQGCCLSATFFSIYISNLEETLLKTVGAGMRIGKRRFFSLTYADDLVAVEKTEEECKLIM